MILENAFILVKKELYSCHVNVIELDLYLIVSLKNSYDLKRYRDMKNNKTDFYHTTVYVNTTALLIQSRKIFPVS